MKKYILIILVVSVISLIIGLAITGGRGGFGLGRKDIDTTQSVDMNGINRIKVVSSSADISLSKAVSSEAKVHYSGYVKSDSDTAPQVSVEKKDGELVINSGLTKPDEGFTTYFDFKLEIELPEAEWQKITIESNWGDVSLSSLMAKEVGVETKSGNISLNNIVALQRLRSTLGNIKVVDSKLVANKEIFTTSGNVNIFLPPESSFSLNYITGSGKISNSTDGILSQSDPRHATVIRKGGQYQINVETTSGDLIL